MRYQFFSDQNVAPLKISSIGFATNTAVTHFGPGQRNLYIIHYITKGKGYYNGRPVEEGQGFLITPGCHEEYHADMENPWEFLWIISSDSKMEEIFSRYNADAETLIFNYDAVAEVRKLANEIISANNQVVDALKMLEKFLHIVNSHTYTPLRNKPNSEIYIDFCMEYIETNVGKKITVEELARLLGVSQPYLYKLFSAKFNMSTKQYIVAQKIKHAKKLLFETEMSIGEIANSVGYNDSLAFSKVFSSKVKASPQNYRARKRQML